MVEPASSAPDRGDFVWISLDPQAGHEQAGRRPAVVVSPLLYNRRTGLALVCPVTSREKNYPFEVRLPVGLPISGVVLADAVKNLDWRARQAEAICALPGATVEEILAKVRTLLT